LGVDVSMNKYQQALDAIIPKYVKMLQLLKDMEWSGLHTDYEDSWAVMTRACPVCMNDKRDGHKPTCRLKELIT